jgi:outer membrane murein-binding lipoprotein Lpp
MNKKGFITTVVTLFFLTGMLSVVWFSGSSAFAQTINSNNQTTATSIDQLTSNLTAARESIASGNTTATTAQLTAIIGELSDILGTVTSDTDGAATDEHTHFFTHKGDTHTVTHKHPHHPSHHHDWFEKHHIFNPSDCKPGLMC